LLALWRRSKPMGAEANEAILIAMSRIRIEVPGLRVRVRHHARKLIFGQTSSMRRGAIALLETLFDDHDPPPVSVVDDVMSRLRDNHPDVRMVAASFLSRHMMAGMPGAVVVVVAAITKHQHVESPMATVLLDALRRIDTNEARLAVASIAQGTSPLHSAAHAMMAVEWQPSAAAWLDSMPPTAVAAELPKRRTSSGPVVEAKDSILPTTITPTPSATVTTPAGVAAAASLRSFELSVVVEQMLAVARLRRNLDADGARSLLTEWHLDDAGVMRLVGVTSPGLSSSSAAAWAAVQAVESTLIGGEGAAGMAAHYEEQLRARRSWVDGSDGLRAALADIDRLGLPAAEALQRRAVLLA
jgi:hypothetical protein